LQARFGRPPRPATKRTCIVIIELGSNSEMPVVGIVVDAVSEVLDITGADIEPAPAFGAQLRTEFIAGMAKVRDRFVILLSVEHVLAIDELAALAGERQISAPALA
jgi:purine-binding chemotaxis protein CheW